MLIYKISMLRKKPTYTQNPNTPPYPATKNQTSKTKVLQGVSERVAQQGEEEREEERQVRLCVSMWRAARRQPQCILDEKLRKRVTGSSRGGGVLSDGQSSHTHRRQ